MIELDISSITKLDVRSATEVDMSSATKVDMGSVTDLDIRAATQVDMRSVTEIGIGTSDVPSNMLMVVAGNVMVNAISVGTNQTSANYKMYINGKILSKGLKIQASGWADYVFDENYQLMPFSELGHYIKANKHLPNVRSEKEVISNGLDTEAMLILQMQKIEELTLYLLEVNKQNQELKLRLEKLEENE